MGNKQGVPLPNGADVTATQQNTFSKPLPLSVNFPSSPSHSTTSVPTSPRVKVVGRNIQRKFASGSPTWNLKVLLRGSRCSGKTALLNVLEGSSFPETYVPTNGIQSAYIDWNYKASEDVVLVEAWDVVDKGIPETVLKSTLVKPQSSLTNLGSKKDDEYVTLPVADATTLDVYQHTNAVVVIVNPFII